MTELWEILVPTVRNDGRPFHARYHRVWDQKVRDITGGLTVCAIAKGQWVSPDGKLFLERMIPVRIACSRNQINTIMKMTMTYYDQLAVMAHRVSDEVIVLKKDGL